MLRVGPELEIPGYGCLDHFLEGQFGVRGQNLVEIGIEGDVFADEYGFALQSTLIDIRGRFWPSCWFIRILGTSSATSECRSDLHVL